MIDPTPGLMLTIRNNFWYFLGRTVTGDWNVRCFIQEHSGGPAASNIVISDDHFYEHFQGLTEVTDLGEKMQIILTYLV
jgi:hypothetical protein